LLVGGKHRAGPAVTFGRRSNHPMARRRSTKGIVRETAVPRRACARESATTLHEIGSPILGKHSESRLIVDGCFQAPDFERDPLLYRNVTPIETLIGNPTVIV